MTTPGQPRVGEVQLRAVLDSIPARVALIDPARRHLYVNQEYARFLGKAPEDILGLTVSETIGAAAFDVLREHGTRALLGETVRWDGWLTYAGVAAPRYVQRVYMPYRNESGAVDGYFIFARDLTDLKLGEVKLAEQLAALHASEAMNAAITASALDCIVVIDEAGCVVEFNPAAEHTFGYSRAETLGRQIGDLIVPPYLRRRHAHGFETYLKTGKTNVLGRRIEIEGMRSSGAVFPVELAITEVSLPGRRLFTAYLRDLTAVEDAKAELQRSREALHQSEKMAAFGSLLAGVAHELNNPLSIVIGNALMLQEDVETEAPAAAARAGKIQAAAERCAGIVRTFLTMARQGRITLRPVEIGPLLGSVLSLLSYGLRSHDIQVEVDIAQGGCRAMGDPDQLNQVMMNLLVNAQQTLEARPLPRRIRIAVATEADKVEIRVTDNGPGVPEAIRSRIFDPFFTTKPAGAGTGIGLAVSRGIAEAHGGSLTLSTPPGGGACFEIRLPRATGAAPQAQPARRDHHASAAIYTGLIVDDEPEVARILAQMLTRQGFRCDIAASGREAQALLTQGDYDALLCDLHMPDLDGPALFAWLATNRPLMCERTAFVTGDTLGHTTGNFLAHSNRPVLEKPFTPSDVHRVVEALIRPATNLTDGAP